jgi:chromosome segregation protein
VRLKSIKLAGFKSFVDPTHFDLPGQLIGVVGPNGCGKSNIIDAVRWVLGESRASELRGESMQDVIFNGSGLRKPSGRASVELVFDNTDGRALGQWSAFGEISVKRVLTRDGASNYLINQQSVRRKDIQDMFLGTGLGPRAYAIIGQGMISRIIEAKPEELRIFLEEAAGVSKYKERRKETESRLESTQENLTRVRDILRELDAQLIKLESQAQVAGLFQEYQSSMQSKQHLLWFMRMTQGETERQRHNERIRTEQVLLEERIALLRSSELSLENTRADQYLLQDEVSQAQAALYEVTAAVAQTESEIRFANESKLRLQAQITDLIAQKNRWQGQLDQATEQFSSVCAQLEQSNADDSQCQANLIAHASILPELEVLWKNSQQAVETTRSACSEIEKELARIQSLAQSLSSRPSKLSNA